MTLMKGKLYIISAPSGAGKTSLVKALVASTRHVVVSVSHTTRKKRHNETDGVHYHFVDASEFLELNREKIFLESAEVFGHFYGTSKAWVDEQLKIGVDVILEIDWQGAQQVRKLMPDCVSVFILPPSIEALKERLIGRSSDARSVVSLRTTQAVMDVSHYHEFDYLVINDEFDLALRDLQTIIRSRRLSVGWVKRYKADILQNLLYNKEEK